MTNSRVWLVTGGSRGIGRAVVEQVLAAGDRVAILARGEQAATLAQELGPDCCACQVDVGDMAAVGEAVESVYARWGRIDVLVNNAGLHRGGRIGKLSDEDWSAVLETNLGGARNTIRAALEYMEEGSSIVNIGAVVGFRGFPGDAAYAASKAGLAGLTRALAIELAGRAITVNLVIPGLVLTEMTSGLSDKALESMRAIVPLGRYGEPDEIASVIHDVASASYMTGAIIPVDGGLMSSFGVPG